MNNAYFSSTSKNRQMGLNVWIFLLQISDNENIISSEKNLRLIESKIPWIT